MAEKSPRQELEDLKESVREEVRELIDDLIGDNPDVDARWIEQRVDYDGRLSEIVDGSVPVYNGDIMELGSVPEIYNHENELPPAFDGTPTPVNTLATSIYEVLQEEAWEEVRRYLEELEDEGKFDEEEEEEEEEEE